MGNVIILTAIFFVSTNVHAQSRITEIQDHPLAKAIVMIQQVGSTPMNYGNGFVVGSKGCHVVTNFHVAFGKHKVPGTEDVVYVDKIDIGHIVEVGADLNPRTGAIDRKIKARVVEFGDFSDKTTQRIVEDLAILKLDNCLGPDYGIIKLLKFVPYSGLPDIPISTLSIFKKSPSDSALQEEQCRTIPGARYADMLPITCELRPGMSGSPLIHKQADGSFVVVGISTGRFGPKDGPLAPWGVYISRLTEFVEEVIGNEATKSAMIPDRSPSQPTQKPQGANTSLSGKSLSR